MIFLAATSTAEKLSKVPPMFWVKVAVGIGAFILAIVLLRKLMQVNKVILIAVSVVTLAVVGFSWIYERNEPEFMTPVVDAIAPFFPSKGAYQVKQSSEPDKPGLKKSQSAKPTTTTPQKR